MRKSRTWKNHAELLEYLIDHSFKQAANHFEISEAAVHSWLYRLRNKIADEQAALNRIRNLQKNFPRIRKLTTKGGIQTDE